MRYLELIQAAIANRSLELAEPHNNALRLFNGFTEGWPDLTIEIYGSTAVLLNQANPPDQLAPHLPDVLSLLHNEFPWLTAILLKDRRSRDPESRQGHLLFGQQPNTHIIENGVIYALDLTLNQDTSLYMDTRNLRQWLIENMTGKRVFNTFAYTGSLGVAALAGGATHVVQTDRTHHFLDVAKESTKLNNFNIDTKDFLAGDFFKVTANLRKQNALFDCAILDPPFFSNSRQGRVDMLTQYHRLVNKIRPLIAHYGWMVAINNALFLSGQDYLDSLNTLCSDGYLRIEKFISIPADCTGYFDIPKQPYPTNPAPFNHPTKIALIHVERKDKKF